MRLSTSVAIATLNGTNFLKEQLQSILDQDVLPDEIIVSDDGSTDGTIEVVHRILGSSRADSIRVDVRVGPKNGVTANFAAAIAACSGDVVFLCDQDDIWSPDRVRISLEQFQADAQLLLHHTDARLIDRSGRSLDTTLYQTLGIGRGEIAGINSGRGFGIYLRRNLATGAVTAFRRSLFAVAAPLPVEWLHDEWLAIIASTVGGVRASTETPVAYRQHGENQVGAAQRTFRQRAQQLFADSERNDRLAARSAVLAQRLAELHGADNWMVGEARAKAYFEARRAAFPPGRARRLVAIGRAAVGGGYPRFASQSYLDILRDIVRPIRA